MTTLVYWWNQFIDLFSMLVYISDVGSDISTLYEYIKLQHYWYFGTVLFAIAFTPCLVTILLLYSKAPLLALLSFFNLLVPY